MKVKIAPIYYCDFCKKRMMRKFSMENHEKRCTMNPDRVCRVCDLIGGEEHSLKDLIKILPDATTGYPLGFDEHLALSKLVNEAIPKLREAAGGCPACIMAAIRQSGASMWSVPAFNFSAEMKAAFSEINESANFFQQARYECEH